MRRRRICADIFSASVKLVTARAGEETFVGKYDIAESGDKKRQAITMYEPTKQKVLGLYEEGKIWSVDPSGNCICLPTQSWAFISDFNAWNETRPVEDVGASAANGTPCEEWQQKNLILKNDTMSGCFDDSGEPVGWLWVLTDPISVHEAKFYSDLKTGSVSDSKFAVPHECKGVTTCSYDSTATNVYEVLGIPTTARM